MAVTITQTWIDDVVSSGNSQFDLNGDTTYELTEDIVISTSNCRYFNMNGTGIVFNGNGHKVTMHNIFGFFGLFIPDPSINGNIMANSYSTLTAPIMTLNNLELNISGTTTLYNQSSFVGLFFSASCNAAAYNCFTNVPISITNMGGIFGPYSTGTAINCYTTGIISGNGAGGIFGAHSKGSATNCYSTGAISGNSAGGIFGIYWNSGTAYNCYSMGAITGANAGSVYSTYNNTNNTKIIRTNCYSPNGTWSDSAANAALSGTPPSGTIWNSSAANTPYTLLSIDNYGTSEEVSVTTTLLSQHTNSDKETFIIINAGNPVVLTEEEGQALAESSPYKAENVTITGPVTVYSPSSIEDSTITVETPSANMGFVIPSGISYTLSIAGVSKTVEYDDTTGSLIVDGSSYVVGDSIQWTTSLNFIIATLGFLTLQNNSQNVPCFPTGTRILTTEGYKPVETLASNDRIQTADGRALAFKLYSRTVVGTKETAPYKIRRGAFGSTPVNDITLSPLHAIQSRNNVWQIPKYAAALNNSKIQQYGIGTEITYYHIELPNYFADNIVAEGSVVESFGGKQAKGMKTVYKYSERLGGFTRANKNLTLSAAK